MRRAGVTYEDLSVHECQQAPANGLHLQQHAHVAHAVTTRRRDALPVRRRLVAYDLVAVAVHGCELLEHDLAGGDGILTRRLHHVSIAAANGTRMRLTGADRVVDKLDHELVNRDAGLARILQHCQQHAPYVHTVYAPERSRGDEPHNASTCAGSPPRSLRHTLGLHNTVSRCLTRASTGTPWCSTGFTYSCRRCP